MIKPAFCTGLRDLLQRLDARMESPTHQKQPACLAYEFALVQGVNILWECRQQLPAAAHEKVNIKVFGVRIHSRQHCLYSIGK